MMMSNSVCRAASDSTLAQSLAAGHDWALREMWRRLAPMVLRLSQRHLGSRSDAEDVAQEVFLRLFRKADALRDPTRLRSFVYTFVKHQLRIERRKRKRRAWLSFEQPEELDSLHAQDPDSESRDLLAQVDLLLNGLQPRDRQVFLLKRVEAMTLDEIVAHTGIPRSTVKRSMTKATQQVSNWLDANPELSPTLR
ncbi:MAG TPA: sigma-70 family RNA polymerase sigma factor [Polyangiaceae bacterium]|jgi:RNA polymerase sigma-70 factor (ECF subfamily)|nr:sigma-70 family RNA polymerase sigma factor [Polyangiaceae bacterium]